MVKKKLKTDNIKAKEETDDFDEFTKNPKFIERECLKCREKYYLISEKRVKCENCGCYFD